MITSKAGGVPTIASTVKSAPKWHRVYYLLAVFDVLVVLFGLFLNHQLIVSHQASVTENQQWSQRLEKYLELTEIAAAVNAPGNNVFDTHDVPAESALMEKSLLEFNANMALHKSALGELPPTTAATISTDFSKIESAMKEMTDEARLIFSHFADGRGDLAGRRMAEMDRKYHGVNLALAGLRRDVMKSQSDTLAAQSAQASELRQYEFLTAAFVLLMVGAAMFYGHKIKKQIDNDAAEKELYQESLQHANEDLERRVEERTKDLADANEALSKYTQSLKVSNRELQDFAHVASHDLQEPLRKVQAFGSRLRDKYQDTLDDNGREYIDRIQNAAARMQTLIQDLLAFSRVNSKAKPFERVDLNEIVSGVVSDLETAIDEKNAEIVIEDLPAINGDPLQMRQLFQNLIGNALKFSPLNRRPRVEIRAEYIPSRQYATDLSSDQSSWRLYVTDNGIGFDEKYVDKIFTVFQRLHGRDEYPGSGVGLSICRRIVERHQGNITAKSRLGQGSTFMITVPAEASAEAHYERVA